MRLNITLPGKTLTAGARQVQSGLQAAARRIMALTTRGWMRETGSM
jgi:hypothetical protein